MNRMESRSKPKTKTKLTSCLVSPRIAGSADLALKCKHAAWGIKVETTTTTHGRRNADDFLWSFVVWLQQTHKTRQEARTNKAALSLSEPNPIPIPIPIPNPDRSLRPSLSSHFSAWMLLGTPRAAWPAASIQTNPNPEKTQLEIHEIPCTFSENRKPKELEEIREEKWTNNKQATRDAEQTRWTTTLATQNSISKTCSPEITHPYIQNTRADTRPALAL